MIPSNVIERYAPVVRFHQYESYFPCSIEHLLQGATLTDGDQVVKNPTTATLAEHPGEKCVVTINEKQFTGQASKTEVVAPIYYAIQEFQDIVLITYIMIYAYQGGQTLHFSSPFTSFRCIVKPFGIHEGDLEWVSIALYPSGSDYGVYRVGIEAHGEERGYRKEFITWEDTHPVIHAALNGHAGYNPFPSGHLPAKANLIDHQGYVNEGGGGPIEIISAVQGNGKVWRPTAFRYLGLDGDGKAIGDQGWAVYQGRLGQSHEYSHVQYATTLDGRNLPSGEWTALKLSDTVANLLALYPAKIREGGSPPAPGSKARPWLRPVEKGAQYRGKEHGFFGL